jgi:hypothetical protein
MSHPFYHREHHNNELLDSCVKAARKGHLDVLKWVTANGSLLYWAWDVTKAREIFAAVAKGGHLNVIKWLLLLEEKSRGWLLPLASPDDDYSQTIEEKGGLSFSSFSTTYPSGRSWGPETCSNAASGGYFEILKWLRAHGCPWDETTCIKALWGGYAEIFKWAVENGCRCANEVLQQANEMLPS